MGKTIFCISGLGADEKVFDNLQINGCTLRYLPWLKPNRKETIQSYAKRMAIPLQQDNPVLLGVSFGGMIGLEIAKQMPVQKLIIVSSIKSTNELPSWMRVVGKMQLNKILPTKSYKYSEQVDNNRIGVTTPAEKEMVRAYRRSADPHYLEWSINQVLNWKNDWQPESLVHIHGDKDKIFPVKKVKPTYIIEGGTHMMIYNRAKEIGDYVEKVIA